MHVVAMSTQCNAPLPLKTKALSTRMRQGESAFSGRAFRLGAVRNPLTARFRLAPPRGQGSPAARGQGPLQPSSDARSFPRTRAAASRDDAGAEAEPSPAAPTENRALAGLTTTAVPPVAALSLTALPEAVPVWGLFAGAALLAAGLGAMLRAHWSLKDRVAALEAAAAATPEPSTPSDSTQPSGATATAGSSGEAAAGAAQEEEQSTVEVKGFYEWEGDLEGDAVLVVGAGGKTGREAVRELLASGRQVIACGRNADSIRKTLAETLAVEADAEGRCRLPEGLVVRGGADVTQPSTLTPELFQGASQVVCAVGPVFGRLPEGGMGYFEGMTAERVDGEGVAHLAAAAAAHLTPQQREGRVLIDCASEAGVAQWQRLDDVIMGGRSSSAWSLDPRQTSASQFLPKREGREGGAAEGGVWSGELVVEGGGFCGTRSQALNADLSAYDGISLRVKGDGQRYKLNVKTAFNAERPEQAYQAAFDTVPGDWITVDIPWREFVAVRMQSVVPEAPPLDPALVSTLGLVLSRFEWNSHPNFAFHPGPFRLEVGAIEAFRAPRPQLLLVSSAGVERNAEIRTQEERRSASMPIVKLNPGGILNWKYAGEWAVRGAGLPYCVLRATGLTFEDLHQPHHLEARQGDLVEGKISRAELAQVIAAAVDDPAAVQCTLEVRRGAPLAETLGQEQPGASQLPPRLFRALATDAQRRTIGLPPFPEVVPPTAEPSEDDKQQILKDPRVQRAAERGDGGRVRTEEDVPVVSQ